MGGGHSKSPRGNPNADKAQEFRAHTYGVTCMKVFDSAVVTASQDRTVCIWRQSQKRIECRGHTHWVTCLALDEAESVLYSGGMDKTLRAWDFQNGTPLHVYEGHKDWIIDIQLISTVLTSSEDGTVKSWPKFHIVNEAEGGEVALANVNSNRSSGSINSSSSSNLESSESGLTRSFQQQQQQQRQQRGALSPLTEENGAASNYSVEGYTNNAGSSMSTRNNIDMKSPSEDGRLESNNHFNFNFNNNDNSGSSGDNQGTPIQASKYNICSTWNAHAAAVKSLIPTGDIEFITGGADGLIKGWMIGKGHISSFSIRAHPTGVNCLVYKSSGTHCLPVEGGILVSGGLDSFIKVWDLKEVKLIRELKKHVGAITCLEISVKNLISGGEDHQVRVWDLTNGDCKRVFEAHSSPLRCLTVLLGGGIVISGANELCAWEIETGRQIREFGWNQIDCITTTPSALYVAIHGVVSIFDVQKLISLSKPTTKLKVFVDASSPKNAASSSVPIVRGMGKK